MILRLHRLFLLLPLILTSLFIGGCASASPFSVGGSDKIIAISAPIDECHAQQAYQSCQINHCKQCLFILSFENSIYLNPTPLQITAEKHKALAYINKPLNPPPILLFL